MGMVMAVVVAVAVVMAVAVVVAGRRGERLPVSRRQRRGLGLRQEGEALWRKCQEWWERERD